MPSSNSPSAVCPCTGLGIPECSCKRCLEEQLRSFSPLLRRGKLESLPQRGDGAATASGEDRAAA